MEKRDRMPLRNQSSRSSWSNRILIVALAGIFFLTFYPFQFTYPGSWRPGGSPFLLNSTKGAGAYDDVLNILLFMPFGFGFAEKIRGHRKSWAATIFLTYLAGALLSYCVEFTQLFIPNRDSGWHDVLTNSAGAAAGAAVFAFIGPFLIHILEGSGTFLRRTLTLPRAVAVVLVYLVVWFAASASLQTKTRLSNWNSDSVLIVANDAANQPASSWRGEVYRLQLWDRAFPKAFVPQISAINSGERLQYSPVAEYDFSAPPYRDRMNFLPALSWSAPRLVHADTSDLAADPKLGLISQGSVAALVEKIQSSNQFSLRLVCKPESASGVDTLIAYILHAPHFMDLQVRQVDADLVVWMRTPVTARTSLNWHVPGVFTAGVSRDILFSYDGSAAALYIDGAPVPHDYLLGPGVALARHFRYPRPKELVGYEYIYYAIGFFPCGILLAACFRQIRASLAVRLVAIAVTLFSISLLFDITMRLVCGRPASPSYIALSVVFMALGIFWLHSDKTSDPSHALAQAA